MTVRFQVHVSGDVYSRTYNGSGGCSRAEAKKLLEELYHEACRFHGVLKSNDEFRQKIDNAKRAVDGATGGASAASNRNFYSSNNFATRAGYVRIDIEIHRGIGHFRS